MDEAYPKIAAKAPVLLDLEPGTYWWCACGLSARQPFCDGAHKVCDLRPVKVEIEAACQRAFCQCKHTSTPPFCDGSHTRL